MLEDSASRISVAAATRDVLVLSDIIETRRLDAELIRRKGGVIEQRQI
jgi:hypothetical protein